MSSQLAGTWNATRAQEFVLSHQRPDGSFGGLFDTNAVLPLLGGRTLLDVALRRCPRVEDDTIDNQDAPGWYFILSFSSAVHVAHIQGKPVGVMNTVQYTYFIITVLKGDGEGTAVYEWSFTWMCFLFFSRPHGRRGGCSVSSPCTSRPPCPT